MFAQIVFILVVLTTTQTTLSTRLLLGLHHHPGAAGGAGEHHSHFGGRGGGQHGGHKKKLAADTMFRILYQIGSTEADLPECPGRSVAGGAAVCSKVDLYESPWLERQCVCARGTACPTTLDADDGYTIADKTRQYKLCEQTKKLPKCRYFRDVTWKLIITPNNATEQIVHCHCPKNSVTYLVKRQPYHDADGSTKYQYSFACSPQSRLRCQRKEPCRLFTVRKRQEFLDEVNTNTLCQCPRSHRCPHHHTEYGVIAGKAYAEESVRTYSGYCLPF